MNLLQIKDLTVTVADRPLLEHLDLTIQPGEIHVIMGPNGAGKSTLMSAIMGDPRYTVTEGTMEFEGTDITGLGADARAKKGIFLSFQAPEEIPGVTLEDFLRTSLRAVTGKPLKVIAFRKALAQRMADLHMDESYAARYLNVGFSGGEKKKAEILQLLMLQPKLALLDETDSGLDVDAVRTVSEGIRAYHNRDNALLIVTHNASILEGLDVDRVHILEGKRIARSGGPELIREITAGGFGSPDREASV